MVGICAELESIVSATLARVGQETSAANDSLSAARRSTPTNIGNDMDYGAVFCFFLSLNDCV